MFAMNALAASPPVSPALPACSTSGAATPLRRTWMPSTTIVSPSSTCARPARRSPAVAGRAAPSNPTPPAPSGSRRAVATLRRLLAHLQGRQLDLVVYDLGHG